MENDFFKDFINGLEFDLPDTGESPKDQFDKNGEPTDDNRTVFVQKIITEVWIYTDIDSKTFGNQTIQDLAVLGEMSYADLLKQINAKKQRRRRNR